MHPKKTTAILIYFFCTIPFFISTGAIGQNYSDTALTELGTLLFFDPVLSGNYRRSCASCHRPQKAFTDQRTRARAYVFAENLTVNTPTLLGVARQRRFFHDGRANSLSAAIRSVLTNPAELNGSYEQVASRLQRSPEYVSLFERALGGPPTEKTIDAALITYLKSLSPPSTRPLRVLPDSLRAGARLFARAGCRSCHAGPDFRDGQRHQVGPGRWVKTPTLRNLPLTPPYLTDGTAPTLTDVLTRPFHARQRRLNPTEVGQLIHFLSAIPIDSFTVHMVPPTRLPDIPGAPPRRIGGTY